MGIHTITTGTIMGQTEIRTIGMESMTDVTVQKGITEKTVTSLTEAAATVAVGKQDITNAGIIAAMPTTTISKARMMVAGLHTAVGKKIHIDTIITVPTVTDGKKDIETVEPTDQTITISVKMTVAGLHTAVGKKTATNTATTAVTAMGGTEVTKTAEDNPAYPLMRRGEKRHKNISSNTT